MSTIIFLPSAGGGWLDLNALRVGPGDVTRFETIGYPGWRRYIQKDFSADTLIAELAAQIEAKVPHGPIRIIGQSIGAHFGYAAALRLQAKGREITGFCAIDAFMIVSCCTVAGMDSSRSCACNFSPAQLSLWRIGPIFTITFLARAVQAGR